MKPGERLAPSEAERVVQLEHALRAHHDLAERVHQGVALLERSGEVVYANGRLAAMVGREPRELVGERIADLVHPSCRAVCERAVETADQRPAALEVELVGRGGELLVVLSVAATQEPRTLCAIVTDLTEQQARARLERELSERRRAESALRESEARFRAMAETVPGLLFACDATGQLQYANARFTEYTGVRPRAGASSWLDVAHWDDRIRCRPSWDRALAELEPFEGRCRLRSADGRFRWFQVRARAVRLDDGEAVQWFGVGADVDDLVRAEHALVDADRRKDRFLMTLAHELRNPLAPIGSAIRFLDRVGNNTSEAIAAREAIKRQVGHLVRIVDDLLDLSRIRRGGVPLRTETCELGQLVRSTAQDHGGVLAASGITLGIEVPDEPLWMDADATRLSQVLRNLLHNANKFTGHGGTVQVTLREDRDRGEAVLTVSDTGVGVAPDMLTRIFDPFLQVGGLAPEGLGLGLALVKGIVALHGGTVVAESLGRGHGTTFVLRLPLGGARAELPPEDSSSEEGIGEPRRRILVVEDDRDGAEMLKALLLLDGHHVEVCTSGEAALRVVGPFRPEVVLCDIGLRGGMDGYTLARALRAVPDLPRFLLVALTGHGHAEDRQRAREAGFDHHLVKPADHDALTAILRSFEPPSG